MSDENMKNVNDCLAVKDVTNQGLIDLSDTKYIFKANYRTNNLKRVNENNNSSVDKVKILNLVTKENLGTGKVDANLWRTVKWASNPSNNNLNSIKHKLPLMPLPERGRNKIADVQSTRKEVFEIETQTDAVHFVTEEDYDIIQYLKNNGITIDALSTVEYNDDINNNMERQSDFEQEATTHPEVALMAEGKSNEEEEEVLKSIEKYSDENKVKLGNFFAYKNNKMSDTFIDPNINKKKDNFLEYIQNSLWQIVICMSHYKEVVEKGEKIRSWVDRSTQTPLETRKYKHDESNFAETANLKNITISLLSNAAESNMHEQKSQVMHNYYQTHPPPPTALRAHCLKNRTAQNQFHKPKIKRPHQEAAVNRLNNQMQVGRSNHFGAEATCTPGQWRAWYNSNMARLQWFNQTAPSLLPPPPPPPSYSQENRFTNQHIPAMAHYQVSSQEQNMSEYQKYQQMEMQKKAWESQLQNYPNSAWSRPEN